jgi:hypothetical protein
MNQLIKSFGSTQFVDQTDPVVRAVLHDPLTQEEHERLAFAAEHPDQVDPLLVSLPEQEFSLRHEAILRKLMKAELQQKHDAEASRRKNRQQCQLRLTIWVGERSGQDTAARIAGKALRRTICESCQASLAKKN